MISNVSVTPGTKWRLDYHMSDDLVAQLRESVTRLLALALKAREDGDAEHSEIIVAFALRYEEKAKALEAAAAKPEEE
jgi:hypothetical protein